MTQFLFFIATILAGTIKALAGGGGPITFPLLMRLVPAATPDARSAVALYFAYPMARLNPDDVAARKGIRCLRFAGHRFSSPQKSSMLLTDTIVTT
jgi:hypothetical protein